MRATVFGAVQDLKARAFALLSGGGLAGLAIVTDKEHANESKVQKVFILANREGASCDFDKGKLSRC